MPLGSLDVALRLNMVENERFLQCGVDIAKGMEYLHKCNFVHRRLRADNILVDKTSCKVAGFCYLQALDNEAYVEQTRRRLASRWDSICQTKLLISAPQVAASGSA